MYQQNKLFMIEIFEYEKEREEKRKRWKKEKKKRGFVSSHSFERIENWLEGWRDKKYKHDKKEKSLQEIFFSEIEKEKTEKIERKKVNEGK